MKKLLFILTACVALAAATRAESASYEKGSSFADAVAKNAPKCREIKNLRRLDGSQLRAGRRAYHIAHCVNLFHGILHEDARHGSVGLLSPPEKLYK